jgi:hypothetical protein
MAHGQLRRHDRRRPQGDGDDLAPGRRHELRDVLCRRWDDMALKTLEHEEPMWEMTAHDAADLGSRRRGVEPLRILIMPQRVTLVTVAPVAAIEPMPIIV